MAYVDRQSGTKRAASLASAAIIQGAVGAVLIYSLAMSAERPLTGRLISTFIPDPPKPQPIPEPQPSASESPRDDTAVDTVTTTLDVNTSRQVFDDGPKIDNPPPMPRPTFDPLPPPPPKPLFTIKGPRPANSQSQWVTTDDYPSRDIRAEHTGIARYRVVVGTNGKVSSCEIVKSSGWPGLDQATCVNVSKRAKFEPGTDENGAKAVDTYTGTVSWQIPE